MGATVVMQERTVETPVEKAVWYYMPTIHFGSRGSAEIDTKTYAEETRRHGHLLNEVPDTPVRIYGYADHSGTEQINKRLTQQRAEALRDYLIDKGIAPERIKTVKGMGIDSSLSGGEALFAQGPTRGSFTINKTIALKSS